MITVPLSASVRSTFPRRTGSGTCRTDISHLVLHSAIPSWPRIYWTRKPGFATGTSLVECFGWASSHQFSVWKDSTAHCTPSKILWRSQSATIGYQGNIEKSPFVNTMKSGDGGPFADWLQQTHRHIVVRRRIVRHCQPQIRSWWTGKRCEMADGVCMAIGDTQTIIEQNIMNMSKEHISKRNKWKGVKMNDRSPGSEN